MTVTLHVSVWVEMQIDSISILNTVRHAPRERVSWNADLTGVTLNYQSHAPRERVSWNAVVFVSVIIISGHAPRERVSWNVTDKLVKEYISGHAPRERVSWNFAETGKDTRYLVTLHVSVWVEISKILKIPIHTGVTLHVSVWVEIRQSFRWKFHSESRSTWACELKFNGNMVSGIYVRHAPRERVSWNMTLYHGGRVLAQSRSTWACELKLIIT